MVVRGRPGLCLAGDVLLMLPGNLFVPGLAAFLAAHVLYIVGFLQPPSPPGVPPFAFSADRPGRGRRAWRWPYAAVPATLIFRALARDGHRSLMAPVAVYLVAILTMAVWPPTSGCRPRWPAPRCSWCPTPCSPSTGSCARSRHGDVAVHVTYHLAQGLLVLSLLH